MTVCGADRRVRFDRPALPEFIERLTVRNLQVGAASLDIQVHRYPEDVGINVLRRQGNVQVVVVT
jgi:hypothetical protein